MRIRILGKQWNLKFVSNLGTDKDGIKYLGRCDHPDTPNPKITILKNLPEEEEMCVTLHEILHALNHIQFSEEWVDLSSKDMSAILWKLGYRKLSKEQRKQLEIE